MEDRRSIRLHRCRFVDWSPSPITAIACPPAPSPPLKLAEDIFPVLAIGHANGNIEIWKWANSTSHGSSSQGWILSQTFFAPKPSKVDSLAFTWRESLSQCSPNSLDGLRLFSTSGGSGILEWDLNRGVVRRFLSSQGGSIWSLAANPSGTHLALGCEDGCIRLVSLQADGFTLERKFDRVKCRILSIAWGPPTLRRHKQSERLQDESEEEDNGNTWEDNWIVTGCSDSSLRKWDVRTGRVLERMSTDRTRNEKTLVWAVGAFSDGTIVSGDSMGMVKFWDRTTLTQTQSFTAHGADILCLTISSDKNAVYTSGVDQKVTEFLSVEVSAGKSSIFSVGKQKRWIQSCSRRLHSHDVRSVVIWPPQPLVPSEPSVRREGKRVAPLLVSGGLDMSLVFTPCANSSQDTSIVINPFNRNGAASFEDGHYHRTSFVSPILSFSPIARLVACRYDDKVVVWRISKPSEKGEEVEDPTSSGWTRVLEMQLKVKNNISAMVISVDGQWLAVADHLEVKLFRLHEVGTLIEPRRVKTFSAILATALPEGSALGATALAFSTDSKRLVIATSHDGSLIILDISEEADAKILRTFNQHRQANLRTRLIRHLANERDEMVVDAPEDGTDTIAQISLLVVSPDGQWLASSDNKGRTNIFNLDSLQHHCALPAISVGLSALSFDTKTSRYLLICMPNNTVRLFDVETKSFPDWQKEFVGAVSKKIGHQRDPIVGASFAPHSSKTKDLEQVSSHQSVILWGANWICRFRIFPKSTGASGGNKRSRSDDEENGTEEESGIKEVEAIQSDTEKTTGGQLFLTVLTQYRNLLGVHFLNHEEMVVIERPLLDVLSHLPPAYFKAKYGT